MPVGAASMVVPAETNSAAVADLLVSVLTRISCPSMVSSVMMLGRKVFLEAVFRPSARAEMTDVAVADSNASMITLLTADWALGS